MFNQQEIIEGANTYLTLVGQWVVSSGLRILVILVLLTIALKSASWFSRRFFKHLQTQDIERAKRTQTLETMVGVVWKTVVVTVAVMLILGELGINLAPILATAGIVGLAVGFGAQELVKDVISGFLILFEDQIRVGDVVNLDGKGGLVEKVNIRTVILRDLDGSVHYVRNGLINVVTNKTKEFSFYVFDVGISYNDDVDKAIEIMNNVDASLRNDPAYSQDILAPLEIFGLDSFGDSALVVKARTKTAPIKQWSVGREFNRRLKKAFDQAGIEIPFPHRTLYVRTESDQTPRFKVDETQGAQATQ